MSPASPVPGCRPSRSLRTCNTLLPTFHHTMFSRIRAYPTTFLFRAQNVRYRITSPAQALTGVRHHTPDSYSKDIDHTPPKDAKVHRVDPDSDRVQKPYEAPSGEWSRAGVKTDEYQTEHPHTLKGGSSKSDEGPLGKSSSGRRE